MCVMLLKLVTMYHTLEFRESDVSPGKTEVKQGKLSNLYPRRKVILEKLISYKT